MARSNTKALGIGIGLGAVAAAAGAYFLYGAKGAAKNRKKVKGWALKVKGEALEEIEKLGDLNEGAYHAAIDKVSGQYQSLPHVDKKELEVLTKELKSHWKHLKKLATKKRK